MLVLGGGSAGYAAARVAGEMGARVGLVERGPVGGLCILDGCMPSKALIQSADALHLMQRSGRLGLDAEDVGPSFREIMARKRALENTFAQGRRDAMRDAAGVELLLGEARFTGLRRLALRPTAEDGTPTGEADQAITASEVVLATGSYAWVPPVPGLEEAGYITSDAALDLDEPPPSMVILGGGFIALELGQFYARMGTRVAVLERGERLLAHEDRDVGDTLTGYLRDEGMEIYTGAEVRRCYRAPDGERALVADVGGERREITGSVLLVATGRRAATQNLGLEAAGIGLQEDGGPVRVDETMRTSNPHVYAAGDVASTPQMTHLAVLQGEVAGYNAARAAGCEETTSVRAMFSPDAWRLGGVARAGPDGRLRMDYAVVPRVIFTDPPFARVGISEQEAREGGQSVAVARAAFADEGMAELMGQTKGFLKMLADRSDGRIVGVQIVGHQADTLIHEAVVAMAFGATAAQLARIPHYHPTLPEIFTRAADELARRCQSLTQTGRD